MKGKVLYRLYDYDDDEAWLKENAEVVKEAEQEIAKRKDAEKERKAKAKRMEADNAEDDDSDADDRFYDDEELEMMEAANE